ncbi:hypothetical protein [Candidatus Odyssella acanthamoebae]|uniref:Uncharacterized protein n=1 Tax=Candidatus Odyssella acanthamoebae TaxID=91604 RepID=A0A077AY63_9PROT|nr:hypothetical protein [Candidatus Paracaedibacter acanthamoebae]AIK95685.1 hypothetical protein ID47_01420 [Candidatus Paracaedibacter acanthamoebae]
MSLYSKDSIASQLEALSSYPVIRIINLTRTNQAWIIPSLEKNSNLTLQSFSYTPKIEKSARSLPSFRMMEKFLHKLKEKSLPPQLPEENIKRDRDEVSEKLGKSRKKKKTEVSVEGSQTELELTEKKTRTPEKRKIEKETKKNKRKQKRKKKEESIKIGEDNVPELSGEKVSN